ncbi:MAG: hypothetical protein HAW63_00150 [Bdellovibrionaceae bacterium]|nr:hypothetical protein [Pseudobdellovibrionaceae bacterium]
MKIILSTMLFFTLTAIQANAKASALVSLEKQHAQEIVNCPFQSQSKVNKVADKRTVASLLGKKKVKKEASQKAIK